MLSNFGWMNWYQELKKYYEVNGNIDVPQKYETEEGLKLGVWLTKQRFYCKDIKKIELLNSLGMKWSIRMENWNVYYRALEEYYKKHGNIDVLQKYETEDGLKLGVWVHNQRLAYRGHCDLKITHGQIQLLNNLGMIWDKHEKNWNVYYHALEGYYKKHGNIDVPQKYETEDGLKLGIWLHCQRLYYSDEEGRKMPKNRIKLLNNLGMKWDKSAEDWNTYYYELEKYYQRTGSVNVPFKYVTEEGLKLGNWLNAERQAYKCHGKSKISRDQIQLLNDFNIDWAPRLTSLLNKNITIENKDSYYKALNEKANYVLRDLSYEVNNQITSENQEELCKTLVKRIWR